MIARLMLRSLVVASLLLAPALARAESAVVLVPEAAVDAAALERARSAAIETLAERGVRLVRAPDGEPCESARCAAAIAAQTGADFVVLVLVEAREDGGSRVRASVVRASGAPRDASADVGDAGFGAATSAALEAALAGERDRRLGFLMVRTDPPGARVEIDGEPAGESPLRRMVAPGEHRVRVWPARGEASERTVTVRPVEETALELDLEADDEEAGPSDAPARTEPSPLNWLIGGGLAIGGVVALVSPLQTLATEGQCVDLIEDVGCVERVQFGAVSGVLLGVGLAALIAAVVVDVVAPIRVEVGVSVDAAGRAGATLELEGRF
jgi:hypothetical protein